jgi:ferredoxin
MKVHIDQPGCTGAGYCEQVAPRVFALEDSGLATVRAADGTPLPDGGAPGVEVAEAELPAVQDAAGMCPGACIELAP